MAHQTEYVAAKPPSLVQTTRMEAERRRRWRRFIAYAVGAGIGIALFWWAWPAAAEGEITIRMICHDSDDIADQLNKRYGEVPVAFGLQSNGNLFQVYSSKEHGTWTVMSSSPDGMSCVIAAGERWESIPIVPAEGPPA